MSRSKQASVLCSSVHAIELDDGRMLKPGEVAADIDIDSVHNAALVSDGHLTVLEPEKAPSHNSGGGNKEGEN